MKYGTTPIRVFEGKPHIQICAWDVPQYTFAMMKSVGIVQLERRGRYYEMNISPSLDIKSVST